MDTDAVGLPWAGVIFFQFLAEAASLDPDDGVCSRVEGIPPIEYGDADEVLLEGIAFALKCGLHNKSEEAAHPIGGSEARTGKHPIQSRLDFLVGEHSAIIPV